MLQDVTARGVLQSRRFWQALTLLWILSLADLGFTLWANRFTPLIEMNPLVSDLLRGDQVGSVIRFKVSSMVLASVMFWMARRSRFTQVAIWGLCAVFGMLMIHWSNYTIEANQHIALAGWGHVFNGLE